MPLVYKGACVDPRYRVNIIVDDSLVLEIKSVERVLPIHVAQVLTYLKLLNLRQGLVIDFNSVRLVDGFPERAPMRPRTSVINTVSR